MIDYRHDAARWAVSRARARDGAARDEVQGAEIDHDPLYTYHAAVSLIQSYHAPRSECAREIH